MSSGIRRSRQRARQRCKMKVRPADLAETERLALGRPVTVRAWGTCPYTGRMIAVVVLPDGRNSGQELVRAGLARWDRYYEDEQELAALEAEARAAKRGLWVDPHPVPPWEFRPPWQRRRLPP